MAEKAKNKAAAVAKTLPAKKTAKTVKAGAAPKAAAKPVQTAPAMMPATVTSAPTAPAAASFATLIENGNVMKNTVKQQTEAAVEQSKKVVEQFQSKAKEAMEQGAKSVEEMNEFARGNVEAVVESGRIAAKALEQFAGEVVEFGKKNMEETTAHVRALASVKNVSEFLQMQSDFARSMFDKYVAEGSKMTERMVKVGGEVIEPISNRFALAADKFAKAGGR
jgi:phasin family protein